MPLLKIGYIAFSVVTILALTGCQTTEIKTSLVATDKGPIAFPLQDAFWGSREIKSGIGTLNLPTSTKGKVPLVVLAHGTAGAGYRESAWSDYLNGLGYGTFILDYFGPRGENGSGRKVPRPKEDVWGALSILSTHPGLDMNKVAVMGFSNGGSVTLNSAGLDPKQDTRNVLPKAFIMVYGGCHSSVIFGIDDYNPALLYIAGSKDQLVKASTCRERLYDKSSSDLDVMVIDGAYHMFDSNRNKTINHPKWGSVTMRADSGATEKARKRVRRLLKRVF